MPRPPPSVSEDTVEASATAMEEEMERIRDLRGNSDDNDMAEDGLVLGPAWALRATVPDGTARHAPALIGLCLGCHFSTLALSGTAYGGPPCRIVLVPMPCRTARLAIYTDIDAARHRWP